MMIACGVRWWRSSTRRCTAGESVRHASLMRLYRGRRGAILEGEVLEGEVIEWRERGVRAG